MANYNEGSDNRLFDKNIIELFGKIFFKNDDVIVNNINEEDTLTLDKGLKNLERLEKEFYGENRHKRKMILPHKREVDYYTENLAKKKEKERDSKESKNTNIIDMTIDDADIDMEKSKKIGKNNPIFF